MPKSFTQKITCFCSIYEIIFLFHFNANSFCEFKECFIFYNNKQLKQITRENYDNFKCIRINNCTCSRSLPFLYDFKFYVNDKKMCYFIKNINYGFLNNI
jgi:hypothetical protein